MRARKIIVYVLLVVLIVVVGFLVYERKFAHAATPPASAVDTSNTGGNNTAVVSNSSTGNTTSNNSTGVGTALPPTTSDVQNMQVIADVKNSQKYADPSGTAWAQVKEAKIGYMNDGTLIYADILFHNGSSKTIDLNLMSQGYAAVIIQVPKKDFSAGQLPPNATDPVGIAAGANNGDLYHMPFTPDVKVAAGGTGEIKLPVWVPGKVSKADVPKLNMILSYNGQGLSFPLDTEPAK